MSIAEKLVTIAENEQKVYDAGKKSGRDDFWDDYLECGKNQGNYLYAFAAFGWNDKTYNPPENSTFVVSINASGMYNYSQITDTKVTLDFRKLKQNVANIFSNSKLKTIRKIIVSEKTDALKQAFVGCADLENVTFEGTIANNISLSSSSKLTLDSLKSIITALKDFSGTDKEFTCKLTLSSDSKTLLENDGATAPNGLTWLEYITLKRWNS